MPASGALCLIGQGKEAADELELARRVATVSTQVQCRVSLQQTQGEAAMHAKALELARFEHFVEAAVSALELVPLERRIPRAQLLDSLSLVYAQPTNESWTSERIASLMEREWERKPATRVGGSRVAQRRRRSGAEADAGRPPATATDRQPDRITDRPKPPPREEGRRQKMRAGFEGRKTILM